MMIYVIIVLVSFMVFLFVIFVLVTTFLTTMSTPLRPGRWTDLVHSLSKILIFSSIRGYLPMQP